MDNSGVKIYRVEDKCIVEFYDVRIVDESLKQWVFDNTFGHYGYDVDVIVHKKCKYLISPEAMKLAAQQVKKHFGKLVLCGSEARPDADDNFATKTYLDGRPVDVCSNLEQAICRIRQFRRLNKNSE